MARYGARRPQSERDLLPFILIVCDDLRTAPAYFEPLNVRCKGRCTIKVIASNEHGASGNATLKLAQWKWQERKDKENAQMWVLIDLENKPNNDPAVRQWRKDADVAGINLAFSKPCFEVWTLAHFVSTGETFAECNAVIAKLKFQWKQAFKSEFPQKKAQADYRKLLDLIPTAITNAKSHNAENSQSWTDIWQVVEEIKKHVDQKL